MKNDSEYHVDDIIIKFTEYAYGRIEKLKGRIIEKKFRATHKLDK
jgi:hypothetical protein